MVCFGLFLAGFVQIWISEQVAASNLAPIIVRGNKLYNSDTKERFMITGTTYEYAIDDDYYDDFETALTDSLSELSGYYNTLRVYNVNPDNSYDKFMSLCDELGVYVIVSGVPANEEYFGDYRYSTMRKDLGPSGDTNCYPAKLLYFGKDCKSVWSLR